MSLPDRHELLKRVARSAGALALDYWRNRERLVIELKGPRDFVSHADRDVESFIRREIAQAFPQDSFLGEETASQYRAGGTRLWIVDPIDGTHNFLRGIAYWAVSIAYTEDGERTLGAVYDPVHDELFHARRGYGAWRSGPDHEVRLSTARPQGLSGAVVSVGHHDRYPDPRYVQIRRALMGTNSAFRNFGSAALQLAHVADGRLDAMIELALSAWDVMAGLLLVEEAGGCVGPYPGPQGITGRAPVIATTATLIDTLSDIVGSCAALSTGEAPIEQIMDPDH
ncbi:MAG TPA: inositol monophosphatase [Casimicrobiaceae bacterium]|nr:inositol monophosphatase [Casimicrobiaceae bacterium]